MNLKDLLVIAVLSALAVYSIHKGLQVVALATLGAAAALLYKWTSRQLRDVAIEAFKKTRSAKVGGLEVEIEGQDEDVSSLYEDKPPLARSLLAGLNPVHVGLLVTIFGAGRYSPVNSMKIPLRDLRARGLLNHDEETMEQSTEVWLSESGQELVSVLIQPREAPIEIDEGGADPEG